MRKVAIITEGSVSLGLGHVSRCLSLASLLRSRADICFITSSQTDVTARIEAAGFEVISADSTYHDAFRTLAKPDVVVIDKLSLDEALARWVRDVLKARLVIFGNTSSANRHANVVVNAIIGGNFRNERRLDADSGTLYLEGPRFVVLRDEFYEAEHRYRYTGNLKRVLLLFGGSDPANLTCRATRLLLSSERPLELTVCVGALFQHLDELERLRAPATESGRSLHIVRDSAEVSRLMLGADFVVTSPGNALFETFALAVPSLAFFQNASQGMFSGFPMAHPQNELDRLESLMFAVYGDYRSFRATVDALEVGRGRNEIADALLEAAA
jgi:spore coat polysaccharide biosynthesis predicted glycosyltransferase SpsG